MRAALAGGCLVAALAISTPAYGAPSAKARHVTSVTVTSSKPGPSDAFTGSALVLHAAITPALIRRRTHISGTVTWTIIGHHGIDLTCTSTNPLGARGKATCRIAAGRLLASESPYRVKASYSGDTHFAPSSTIFFQSVTPRLVHLQVRLDAKPESDLPTTITVAVRSGMAAPLVTGYIGFTVQSSVHRVNPVCKGGAEQELVNASATCVLPAGWLHVKRVSRSDRHPVTDWSIVASYGGGHWGGQVNFVAVTKEKKGSANIRTAGRLGRSNSSAACRRASRRQCSPDRRCHLCRDQGGRDACPTARAGLVPHAAD